MPPSENGTVTLSVTWLTESLPGVHDVKAAGVSKARLTGSSNPEAKVMTAPAGVTSLTVLSPPSAT